MTSTAINTALETAAAVAAQTLAVSDPKVATVVALAPLVVQFLDAATKLQQAGGLPPEQLAALFLSTSSGIQSAHEQWAAMNAAAAK